MNRLLNPFTVNRIVVPLGSLAFLVMFIGLVVLALAQVGCIAYHAPVFALVRGPEANYNQDGAGVQSRATQSNGQVAKRTAPQLQLENTATAEMASAMEATKTVGLKQGVAQDKSNAQGRDDVNSAQSSTGKVTTGHQGSDTLGVPDGTVADAAGAAAKSATGGTGTAGLTAEKAAAAAALLKQAAAATPTAALKPQPAGAGPWAPCPLCLQTGLALDDSACPSCKGAGWLAQPEPVVTPAAK